MESELLSIVQGQQPKTVPVAGKKQNKKNPTTTTTQNQKKKKRKKKSNNKNYNIKVKDRLSLANSSFIKTILKIQQRWS